MQLVTASQASDSAEGCLLLYKSKACSKVSQQFFLNAMLIQVPCVIVATIDQELTSIPIPWCCVLAKLCAMNVLQRFIKHFLTFLKR